MTVTREHVGLSLPVTIVSKLRTLQKQRLKDDAFTVSMSGIVAEILEEKLKN